MTRRGAAGDWVKTLRRRAGASGAVTSSATWWYRLSLYQPPTGPSGCVRETPITRRHRRATNPAARAAPKPREEPMTIATWASGSIHVTVHLAMIADGCPPATTLRGDGGRPEWTARTQHNECRETVARPERSHRAA